MKTLFVLILIIATTRAVLRPDIVEQWNQYKVNFKKQYATLLEEGERFRIFQDKLAEIERHNAKYAKGEVTYTKGINQFTDWSKKEISAFLNQNKMLKSKIPGKYGKFFVPSNAAPATEVDWRDKDVVTEVKWQGDGCQSCWSFAATGALEGQLAIHGHKLVSLSEQNLMDCSTNYGNHGCGKGRIDFAFNYIHDYGVESENNYPYEGRDDTCRFNKSLSVTKVSAYNWITSGDELALQKAVDQVGPIAAAIQATFPFLEYEGGYLYDKYCSSKKGDANHAVLVVGYGSNGTHDYWIVKNSFGTTWGDSGYAYMARNADNNCGIATQALYPVL